MIRKSGYRFSEKIVLKQKLRAQSKPLRAEIRSPNQMSARDLHYSGLVELGQRIAKREVSSVQATQAQLDRIAPLDGRLKSYARRAAAGDAFQRVTDWHLRHPLL